MSRRFGTTALRQHVGRRLVTLAALLAVLGGSSVALAGHGQGGGGSGKFAATFDARAVRDPSIQSCPALGPDGQKIEARYGGTMTVDGEEYAINFTTLEALFDRSAGVGSAEGRWQLTDPRTGDVVGRGEVVAAVVAVDIFHTDLQLHGIVDGTLEQPHEGIPVQRLLGSFTASLGDGATFPHLKGAVGDPSVGDPSVGDPSSPAVLLPAVRC